MFKKIILVLLACVVGLAMAWIHPVQPAQVQQAATPNFAKAKNLLDNDDVVLDTNIHNSRKCKFTPFPSSAGYGTLPQSSFTCSLFSFHCRRFLCDVAGGFCMGVSINRMIPVLVLWGS